MPTPRPIPKVLVLLSDPDPDSSGFGVRVVGVEVDDAEDVGEDVGGGLLKAVKNGMVKSVAELVELLEPLELQQLESRPQQNTLLPEEPALHRCSQAYPKLPRRLVS